MRLKWVFPIFLGVLLAFSVPTESAPLVTYLIKILPASGSSGQAPFVTCGFHGGSCGTGSGDFLDWDNTSTTSSVYFRGIFTRGGAPRETNRLFGRRIRVSGGSRECEDQRVYVVDSVALQVRGTMRFLHTSMNSTSDFSIATSGDGEMNSRTLGGMISDTGCGSWSGTHVHAGYTTTGSASRSKNTSRFPSGDYCTPGVNCNNYTNTSSTNWTHKFTWSGN